MFPGDDELRPLIEGMGQGETTALADFVEIVGPYVYGIHLRATGQTVAAAVLTERTFAELWRTAPLYDRQFGTPSDWILAVARGMSVDHLARRRGKESRLKSRPDAAAILAAVDAGPLVEELVLERTLGAARLWHLRCRRERCKNHQARRRARH